jgi:hypothetical protein
MSAELEIAQSLLGKAGVLLGEAAKKRHAASNLLVLEALTEVLYSLVRAIDKLESRQQDYSIDLGPVDDGEIRIGGSK